VNPLPKVRAHIEIMMILVLEAQINIQLTLFYTGAKIIVDEDKERSDATAQTIYTW